jgi:hypothetical protein
MSSKFPRISAFVFLALTVLATACGGGGSSGQSQSLIAGATPSPSPSIQLQVSLNGSGQGTVTSSDSVINCGNVSGAATNCSENIGFGSEYSGDCMTLTATAAAGSTFVGWGGACSGQQTCLVYANQAALVIAQFAPLESLTVTITGNGIGAVYSADYSILCGNYEGSEETKCSTNEGDGATITLTALVDPLSVFSQWTSGPCAGSTSPTCSVSLNSQTTVSAQFSLVNETLSVALSGVGQGVIQSYDGSINCGNGSNQCSTSMSYGTVVNLTATAMPGYVFAGWVNGPCAGSDSPTCSFELGYQMSISASFNLGNTLSASVSGPGFIESYNLYSDNDILCGNSHAVCSGAFVADTEVLLYATANSGHTFVGWSGACSGSSSPCIITMYQAYDVSAVFQ